jgi:hypothetical protein
MTQTTSVAAKSQPASPLLSSLVASSAVASSPVESSTISPVVFPPDVVRLLEVFARIEARRQARLRALREREAS